MTETNLAKMVAGTEAIITEQMFLPNKKLKENSAEITDPIFIFLHISVSLFSFVNFIFSAIIFSLLSSFDFGQLINVSINFIEQKLGHLSQLVSVNSANSFKIICTHHLLRLRGHFYRSVITDRRKRGRYYSYLELKKRYLTCYNHSSCALTFYAYICFYFINFLSL